MSVMTSSSTAPRGETFEQAATHVAGELQASLAELVSHLPGKGARAVDIERGLGLDKKRGWQLYKVATAPTPLAEIAHIPGSLTMKRILTAASRRKLPRESVDRLGKAFEQFEAFVQEHGGDREEFFSLASGVTQAETVDTQLELRIRKTAFKAMAHLWGIRAETIVRTAIFNVAADAPDALDGIRILGNVGLQRLRRGVPLTVALFAGNDPASRRPSPDTPIADMGSRQVLAKQSQGLELLPEFSTQPLPRMEQRHQPDGSLETEILFPPSSKAGAVTLYTHGFVANVTKGEQIRHVSGVTLRIPCETLVCELLVPVGYSNPATVRAAIFGRRDNIERVYERRPADLLPQRETAYYLGEFDAAPPLAAVPHHMAAVRHVLADAGWDRARFDLYRVIVQYPVLHALLSLDVDAINPDPSSRR